VVMNIETAQYNLTDTELSDFRNLFKYILTAAKHSDPSRRLRGNIILSLDGHGKIKTKVESYHELATIGANGLGADKTTGTNNT
jgi:hypothetical protein